MAGGGARAGDAGDRVSQRTTALQSEASLVATLSGSSGLGAGGFVEGQNVSIEYRFADGRYEQVPVIATELARHVAGDRRGGGTAAAAKAATSMVPIVFSSNTDPVRGGLVTSFNRPGGNVTGVSNLSGDVTEKRLQLLHDLLPGASAIGYLINPSAPADLEAVRKRGRAAAASLGLEVHFLEAGSERDFEKAFEQLQQLRAGALLIGPDPYFPTSRSEQLAGLALRYRMPASYQFREFAAAGGLMSYGGKH